MTEEQGSQPTDEGAPQESAAEAPAPTPAEQAPEAAQQDADAPEDAEAPEVPEVPAAEAPPTPAEQAPEAAQRDAQAPEVPDAPEAPDAPEGETASSGDTETTVPEGGGEAAATPADEPVAAATEEAPAPKLVELAGEARYFATGKRKSSVARVILRPGSGSFELNGRSLEVYFPRSKHQAVVRQPLDAAGLLERVDVRARIHGGGISGQADAVRHGIAKALIEVDPNLRGELKRRQFLTRDPRVKERRKAGLKKARKRPQFSKR